METSNNIGCGQVSSESRDICKRKKKSTGKIRRQRTFRKARREALRHMGEKNKVENEGLVKFAQEEGMRNAQALLALEKERLLQEARVEIEKEMRYKNKIPDVFDYDLSRFEGETWLNDTCITLGLHILANWSGDILCLSTMFYTHLYQGRKVHVRENLGTFSQVLIPVHYGNHWVLSRFLPMQNIIITYDPLKEGETARLVNNLLSAWIRCDYGVECVEKFDTHSFPKQTDRVNCGVYILEYARAILFKKECCMDNIPRIRMRWKEELGKYSKQHSE